MAVWLRSWPENAISFSSCVNGVPLKSWGFRLYSMLKRLSSTCIWGCWMLLASCWLMGWTCPVSLTM